MIVLKDTPLACAARTILVEQNGTGVSSSVFWTELRLRMHGGIPQTAGEREQLLEDIGAVVDFDEDDEESVPVIRLGV